MRHFVFILAFLIAIISCAQNPVKSNISKNSTFDSLPTPTDSTTKYFNFKNNWKDTTSNALDTFVNEWYSKQLFRLKEPLLYNYQGEKEIYRFTWLRTFHHPVSIRVEKQNEVIILFSKVTNGAGGYDPGNIIVDTSRPVSKKEWENILNKIKAIQFWQLPTEIDDSGNDGSEWIIEAFKNGSYHMTTRWSPTTGRNGNYSEVGRYLLEISKAVNITEPGY
jgi:hypothetical protein